VVVLPWARDRFREKLTGPNVRYLHTKYMLVDLLGDDPIVVSGSANFSKPSCTTDTWWEPFFEDTKNARRWTFLA
jgi:phosphatidylserine/phosphatidylglycerophosphate/cardiolipin synthase-like enzyme